MSPLLKLSLPELQHFFIAVIPHHHHLGLQMIRCSEGQVVIDLPYSPMLAVSADEQSIHQGAIITLIDTACGSVVPTLQKDFRRTATLDLRVDFFRPARPRATVRCQAQCLDFGSDLAFVRASVHDGDTGQAIAVASGTFAVFKGKPGECLIADAMRMPPATCSESAADSYAAMMGFDRQIDGASLIGRMAFQDQLIGNTGLGALHGGTVATLLQLTAAAELKHQVDSLVAPRLFNFTVEYLGPNLSAETQARASIVSRSKRFANVRVTASQDRPEKTTVATAQFLLT